MRISDWSSDVFSSDLFSCEGCGKARRFCDRVDLVCDFAEHGIVRFQEGGAGFLIRKGRRECDAGDLSVFNVNHGGQPFARVLADGGIDTNGHVSGGAGSSEEHTSELKSLMRISYDVFC